jgi:glycerol-3-phosphate acyltransferase PlsY
VIVFTYIAIAVIAYLLGNISTSYIIGKKMSGVDIRTQGSGNAGSTNVMRTLGKKAGAMTFIGDLLKGLIAVFIGQILGSKFGIDRDVAGYVAVVFVVCGHNWPAFLGFRGGKGVATSLGAVIAMNPVIAMCCLSIFLVITVITKYVSLGSIIGIAFSIPFMFFSHNYKGLVVAFFLTISVAFTHRANIKRLLNGEENKIGSKK